MEGMPPRPNFPPRFDGPGPPEFFNRMPFDDHHPRHRRHDDRRRFPRDDGPPEMLMHDKPDRRSRWSSGSPSRGDEVKSLTEQQKNEPQNDEADDREVIENKETVVNESEVPIENKHEEITIEEVQAPVQSNVSSIETDVKADETA